MNAPRWLCLLACTILFISVDCEEPEDYVKVPVKRRSIPSSMEDDRLKKYLRRKQHDSSSSGTMEDDRLKKALRNHKMAYGSDSIGTMEDDNLKKALRRKNRLYDSSSSSSSSSSSMDDDRLKRKLRNRYKENYKGGPRFRRKLPEPNTVIEHYGNYHGDVIRHKNKDRSKSDKKHDLSDFKNHNSFKKKKANKFVQKRYDYPMYKRIEIPADKKDS